MNVIRSRGWALAALWTVLLLALRVALRQSPLFTGAAPTGSGVEAWLGAPIWAFLPLLGVVLFSARLTFQWWRDRPRVGKPTRPIA
jgi:hypothetical protein